MPTKYANHAPFCALYVPCPSFTHTLLFFLPLLFRRRLFAALLHIIPEIDCSETECSWNTSKRPTRFLYIYIQTTTQERGEFYFNKSQCLTFDVLKAITNIHTNECK